MREVKILPPCALISALILFFIDLVRVMINSWGIPSHSSWMANYNSCRFSTVWVLARTPLFSSYHKCSSGLSPALRAGHSIAGISTSLWYWATTAASMGPSIILHKHKIDTYKTVYGITCYSSASWMYRSAVRAPRRGPDTNSRSVFASKEIPP